MDWKKLKGQKVHLAFRTYKIDVTPTQHNDFDGLINYQKREIWLDPEIEEAEHARQTLFHEIAHAFMRDLDEAKLNNNEKFISQLGNHLEVFCLKNLPLLEKLENL